MGLLAAIMGIIAGPALAADLTIPEYRPNAEAVPEIVAPERSETPAFQPPPPAEGPRYAYTVGRTENGVVAVILLRDPAFSGARSEVHEVLARATAIAESERCDANELFTLETRLSGFSEESREWVIGGRCAPAGAQGER